MARYWFNNSNHSVNLLFTFGPRVDKKSIPIGIGAAFDGIISTVSALHCNKELRMRGTHFSIKNEKCKLRIG